MTLEEALNESLKLKGGNFITSAFRKWSLDWSKYAVIKLNEKFLDNESILFAIDISMTNKHFDNTSGFFVITNIRVLFYYTDGTIERLDVLPLNAIQTLELGGSDIWSHLHIVGLTDTFHIQDKPVVISKIHDILDDLVYSSKASPINENSSNETDTIQVLKSYKELLDAGVITQEEFEKKKAQLLNL